jgi:8-oxo-dGTP pyrophosphatase MutT (NUDIX family)
MRSAAFIIFHAIDPDIAATGSSGRVAMVLKRNPDIGNGSADASYGAVGGLLNLGETPEQGARREAGEELNHLINIDNNKLVPLREYVDDLTKPGNPAQVNTFACELTPEQLADLKQHAAMLDPANTAYDPAFAAEFFARTDKETIRFELPPIEKAAELPFFYPLAGQDYEATIKLMEKPKAIEVTHQQVEALLKPNVKPDPDSLWLLVQVPAISADTSFTPSPSLDEKGNPSGLIAIEDGQAVFRNPKDSLNGKHSTQKLPLDGTGVLIFPVKKDTALGHKMGELSKDLQEAPSLQSLDKLLKDVHRTYEEAGAVPDMYNSDTGHFGRVDRRETIGSHEGVGLFAKKEKQLSLLVLKAPNPETDIAFESSGAFITGGKQYGKGLIVLVKDGDEIRKMAPDYAVENFVYLDGSPLTLESLPSVTVDEAGRLGELTGNQPLKLKINHPSRGEKTMGTLEIKADDLKDLPKIKVMNNTDLDANGRVLASFQVYENVDFSDGPEGGPGRGGDKPFVPNPADTNYPSGNNPKLGIKRVERDDSGRITGLIYDNPKDSAPDKYTEQRYDITGGNRLSTFIFPAQGSPELRKDIIAAIDNVAQGSMHLDVTDVDMLLKDVYKVYEKHGVTPDMYNGGVDQLKPAKHMMNEAETRSWGGGAAKSAKVKDMVIIDANDDQQIKFVGKGDAHIVSQEQFSTGPFVVVLEGDSARKLDFAYAEKDLLSAETGKPMDMGYMIHQGHTGVVSADKIGKPIDAPDPAALAGGTQEVSSPQQKIAKS